MSVSEGVAVASTYCCQTNSDMESAQEYKYSDWSAYDLAIVFLLCYVRPKDAVSSKMTERGNLAKKWETFFDSINW